MESILETTQEDGVLLQFPKLNKGGDPRQGFASLLAKTGQVTNLGWDTTYVITADHANTILAKHKLWPKKFEYSMPGGYKISGDFGLWQITPGGDGPNLYMSTKVPNGTMTMPGSSGGPPTVVKFENMNCIITVKLNLLPQPNPPANTKGGTPKQWKVKTKASSAADPAVSVNTVTFDGPAPSPMQKVFIAGLMDQWFIDHIAEFTHVFSTVNLNKRPDS